MKDTLDPLLFVTDRTHHTNFAANNKVWTVYMSIGNLSLKICLVPSMHSVKMVSLLPIPIKISSIPLMRLDEQWQTNL
jgi:hypothetical protein